jgi:hypothetical protein
MHIVFADGSSFAKAASNDDLPLPDSPTTTTLECAASTCIHEL